MEDIKTCAAAEAVIFSSGEPISADRLSQALGVSKKDIKQAIGELQKKYADENSGVRLLCLDGSYQFVSSESCAEYVKAALEIKRNSPLSQAAMEVLAIIAYNQPVSKSFIEQVRGVDSSQTVNNLADKGLVEEAGRLDVPGRPIIYKTSLGFLKCFQLNSLDDLPPLPGDDAQMMIEDVIGAADSSGENGAEDKTDLTEA